MNMQFRFNCVIITTRHSENSLAISMDQLIIKSSIIFGAIIIVESAAKYRLLNCHKGIRVVSQFAAWIKVNFYLHF